MTVARSVALFVAALFEIGGAWLVWQGIREHKGWVWIGAGIIALGLYGVVATFQSDDNFGRILAAYGGIFVAGSVVWGMAADGYRPDRYDIIGALVCLAGMAVIMYAPRSMTCLLRRDHLADLLNPAPSGVSARPGRLTTSGENEFGGVGPVSTVHQLR